MPNPTFQIKLTAKDEVSPVAEKARRALENFGKTATDVGKAANLGAFDKWAGTAAKNVTAAAASLTAAGIAAAVLGRSAAASSIGLQDMAARIGITAQQLSVYRGVARMANIATETMDGSLDAFASTLNKVAAGTADSAEAAEVMSAYLGVRVRKDAKGTIDVLQTLLDVTEAISSKTANPQAQAIAADKLGLGGLLPLIQRGLPNLRRLVDESKRAGAEISDNLLDANRRIGEGWGRAMTAFDAFKDRVGPSLVPWFDKAADAAERFFAGFTNEKAARLAEVSGRIFDSISRTDWSAVADKAKTYASALETVADSALRLVTKLEQKGLGGLLKEKAGEAKAELLDRLKGPPTPSLSEWWNRIKDGATLHLGSPIPGDVGSASRARIEAKYGLPAELLTAIRQVESSGGKNLLGPETPWGRAEGPYMLMPATQKAYGVKDPYNEEEAGDAAGRLLSDLLRMYGGNVLMAIAAYHDGPGTLRKRGGVPTDPGADYVNKVMAAWQRGQVRFGTIGSAPAAAAASTPQTADQLTEVLIRMPDLPPNATATVVRQGRARVTLETGRAMPVGAN